MMNIRNAVVFAAALGAACAALAQGPVSATPPLTAAQVAAVQAELDAYRRDVEMRFAQGSLTHDEAQRLMAWRQFQLAQQAAGTTAPSQILQLQAQADAQRAAVVVPGFVYDARPPAFGVLWALRPSICAGGFSRGWGGSVCF